MLRKYKKEDCKELTEMLAKENILPHEMYFEKGDTVVLEEEGKVIGFYTFFILEGSQILQHFCIKKEFRNVKNAWKLWLNFRKQGFDIFSFSVLRGHSKLIELLNNLCHVFECYATTDSSYHYIATFRDRRLGYGWKR